jgi:hypothetical protein
MKIIPVSFLILAAALFGGCVTQRVRVVDSSNRPIAGADVEPISASMNHGKLLTDQKGEALLPHVAQKIQWVSVTKEGFAPSGQVPVGDESAVVVILSPAK